jgi:hypothetical protein
MTCSLISNIGWAINLGLQFNLSRSALDTL